MAQGTLGAAGVRRVSAGAGLQRAAYRKGGYIARLHAQLVFLLTVHYEAAEWLMSDFDIPILYYMDII